MHHDCDEFKIRENRKCAPRCSGKHFFEGGMFDLHFQCDFMKNDENRKCAPRCSGRHFFANFVIVSRGPENQKCASHSSGKHFFKKMYGPKPLPPTRPSTCRSGTLSDMESSFATPRTTAISRVPKRTRPCLARSASSATTSSGRKPCYESIIKKHTMVIPPNHAIHAVKLSKPLSTCDATVVMLPPVQRTGSTVARSH